MVLAEASQSPMRSGKIAAVAEKRTRITAAGMNTRGAAIGNRPRAVRGVGREPSPDGSPGGVVRSVGGLDVMTASRSGSL
ncbi:hypothetical protein NOK12_09600 [Nocardioides sp. OK12]|nr:hypothetical protein NOK12_09600 [Nocardioides sp. OK12]